MGVSVYIDGRPAECCEDYNRVIEQLGATPDESQNRFELWTTQARGHVTYRSVSLIKDRTAPERNGWQSEAPLFHPAKTTVDLRTIYRGANPASASTGLSIFLYRASYIVRQDETRSRFSRVSKEKP